MAGANSEGGGAASPAALPGAGTPLGVKYTAHMIIDTDVEFWEKVSGNLPGNTGNPTKNGGGGRCLSRRPVRFRFDDVRARRPTPTC